MSKGDVIKVEYAYGDHVNTVDMHAMTNGSSVQWQKDRDWLTVEELSKTGSVVRTLKVKVDHVIGVLEVPRHPTGKS